MRCGSRLLNPDGRVREVVGAGHERVGLARQLVVDDDGIGERLLLGLEIVVEQFLVEEFLCGQLLGECVEGELLRRRWWRRKVGGVRLLWQVLTSLWLSQHSVGRET